MRYLIITMLLILLMVGYLIQPSNNYKTCKGGMVMIGVNEEISKLICKNRYLGKK